VHEVQGLEAARLGEDPEVARDVAVPADLDPLELSVGHRRQRAEGLRTARDDETNIMSCRHARGPLDSALALPPAARGAEEQCPGVLARGELDRVVPVRRSGEGGRGLEREGDGREQDRAEQRMSGSEAHAAIPQTVV